MNLAVALTSVWAKLRKHWLKAKIDKRYRKVDAQLPYNARYTPDEIWRVVRGDKSFIVIENDGRLSWQYWERGKQGETQETYEIDELLYFIAAIRVFCAASRLELHTRNEADTNRDIYRNRLGFEMTLFNRVNTAWAEKRLSKIYRIRSENPDLEPMLGEEPLEAIALPPQAFEIMEERPSRP